MRDSLQQSGVCSSHAKLGSTLHTFEDSIHEQVHMSVPEGERAAFLSMYVTVDLHRHGVKTASNAGTKMWDAQVLPSRCRSTACKKALRMLWQKLPTRIDDGPTGQRDGVQGFEARGGIGCQQAERGLGREAVCSTAKQSCVSRQSSVALLEACTQL